MNKFMSPFNRTPDLVTKHHFSTAIKGIGAFLTNKSAERNKKRMMKELRENKSLWDALQTPSIENLQVNVGDAIAQGKLDPALGQAILQDPSFMESVGANPQLVQAQQQSLQSLQDVGRSGGQDALTRSRMAQTMGQVGQQERANREALQAQMQRRGIGGSGIDLAQQAIAQQRGADRTAQLGFQTAADAEQRALQALSQSGQMAGEMRGQQFSEDESRAAAMDRISQFNTRHRQQLQDANLNRINQAQQYNLGMNERNVDRQMTARYHNTGAYGQKFNMDRSKIVGQTGARSDLAGVHRNKMDRMNKATSGLLKGMESDINKAVGGMTGNPGAAMGGQGGGTGAYGGGVQTYSTRNQPQLMAADGTVVKSYNTGGMIPGNEFAGDRVDAQVNSGEMILNVEQQQNLLDLLAGKTNQIDSSVPIVQDNPQMAGPEQAQQQPMQEESMMDPLAEARQQQQMQQQQAPKLIPDFQSASPAAPIMPPEAPIDALAGMPQEQPISAADGAIAPQPWQQVVYPPVEGAAPMTPMDPTAPVAPVPTAPQGPVQTDAPLETVNVPDTQMAPVTEFGSQPQAPVEQPYVDPAQQQQQQPQQGGTNFLEMLGAPKGSGIGGAVASGFGSGLGALAMAADPDTAMGIDRETRAREEREKVRTDRKQQMEQDKLEKAYSAQQSRLQKQADAAKKREQDLADFTTKEKIKKGVAKEAKIEEGQRRKSFQEVRKGWTGDTAKRADQIGNMIDSYANVEKLLKTRGFKVTDPLVRNKLYQAIKVYGNYMLRKDSGAAIGEVERAEFLDFLPKFRDGTLSPELIDFQLKRMAKWGENAVMSLGTTLPEFTDHLDTRVSGFYNATLPGGFFKYGQKQQEEQAQGGDPQMAKMSDAELEAASAQWEADNAR